MVKSFRITVILVIITGFAIQISQAQSGGNVKKQIDLRTIPFSLQRPDSSTGFGNKPSINQPVTLESGLSDIKNRPAGKTEDSPSILLPPVTLRYAVSGSSRRGQSQRSGNATFADKAYQFFGECVNMSLRYKYPSLSAPKSGSIKG